MNTSTPILVTFVGMAGSGKDTCGDYVVQKYNVPQIHFGHIVYEEVAARGLDIVKDEKSVREDMRAQDGPAVLAKRVATKAHALIKEGKTRIVINGLYSWSEYKFLTQEFGDQLITISLAAPRALRWQRVVNRQDSHRRYSLEQVQARDIAEIENLEKGGPIAYANYTILNDQTPDHLLRQLDAVLHEIRF